MNKIILIGRLAKDPELRHTQSNTAVAQFTLAVSRPRQKDKEQETDFIPVVVWGAQAENSKKYLLKGSQVALEGRLQIRNYDDKDGKRVYITEVVAENVQFLDSKTKTEKQEAGDPYEEMGNQVEKEVSTGIELSDSELPF